MTEAERLAELEIRVNALNMELSMLKALLDTQAAMHQRCHEVRQQADAIAAPVIRKSAELLGRCLVADQALLPADIAVCAQDLLAVWNEASA